MKDPVYVAELKHDSGVKATEKDLQDARDELIWRVFNRGMIGRFHLDAYVEQFSEEIAAFANDCPDLCDFLETRIRAELADSDEARELAAEFAQERT